MENLVITISFVLAFINLVALVIGYQFDKFKIVGMCLLIFHVLTIMTMIKLIELTPITQTLI